MKNLISNTAFGKLLLTKHLSDKQVRDLRDNYDEFLSLILEIWMFVPCDEDGNVLENPSNKHKSYFQLYLKKFQKAKERCLFEGFRYDGFKYLDCKNYSFRILEIKNMTIENLVKHAPELTRTAIKQLGV